MSFFDNIPFEPRSKRSIEEKIDSFLYLVSPSVLSKPTPIDLEHLLTVDLARKLDVRLDIIENDDFGNWNEGVYDPFSNTIKFSEKGYQKFLDGDLRSRFTVAHESYHAIDHGKQIRNMGTDLLLQSAVLQRKKKQPSIPVYKQAEWQANQGAGAILMPARTLIPFIDKLENSQAPFLDLTWEVAHIYHVSTAAAETRINKIKAL